MAHALVIDRFQAEYLVPASHSAPARIKADLDAVVSQQLPQALMEMLARWLTADEGIWLIRRLDLDVTVNVAWDSHQLARHWALRLVLLLTQIRQDAGENAVYFTDAVQFRAHFVADLAAGQAWQRWYYGPFAGLRALPISAALRTTLVDEPAVGILTLLALAPQTLAAVLDALSPADARRVVAAMRAPVGTGDLVAPLVQVWAGWHAAVPASEGAHAALRLAFAPGPGREAATMPAQLQAAAIPARLQAAVILVELAQQLAQGTRAHAAKLAAAVVQGDVATIFLILGAAAGEQLQPLLAAPAAWRQAVVATLLAQEVYVTSAAEPLRHTPFGGAFLLLPMLDALRVPEDWPAAGEQPTENLLRFLVLVKCLGQQRAARLFYDPVLRDLLGIHPAWTAQAARAWLAQLRPAHIAQLLHDQQEGEPPRQEAARGVLVLVRQQRRLVALVIDHDTGSWQYAIYAGRGGNRGVAHRLATWLLSHGQKLDAIYADAPLRGLLQPYAPALQVEPIPEPAAGHTSRAWLDEFAARQAQLPADLAYVQLPATLRGAAGADLALGVLAQRVLRRFAGRLPGFARSSLPHLFANFLDFDATVEEEATRRVVRVSKPPLNMILSMTGISRSSYQLAWLDARPVALFQQEDWQ